MKKWYIPSALNDEIHAVECIKETEKQAVILDTHWDGKPIERRLNKEGVLFNSFLDAKNFLIEKSKNEIAYLQSRLDSAKAKLKKRNDIPHPKV